jgi:protease-4
VFGFLARRASILFLFLYDWVLARLGRRPAYGIVRLELDGEIGEEAGEGRFERLFRRSSGDFVSTLTLLRWAREDERVKAVFIESDGIDLGWARLQGLRRSFAALRSAGKRVWVHLNGAGLQELYLASAADRITLAPAATLDAVGIASESVFFLDALEKLGIKADVVHMGRYKSAGEQFTRNDMSAAHREMMESLIDDLYGQAVDGIASGRALAVERVRELLDGGPFLAAEAVENGLLDAAGYADQVLDELRVACEGAEVIEHDDYASRRGREKRRELLRDQPRKVALLTVSGTIRMGDSLGGIDAGGAASARTFAKCLEEIRERDDLAALLLRVASPGGSGVASDLMWRELVRTAEMKPMVVSFGDIAASGGYYIALAGKKVFAEAGTLTGSIGVVAGKATLRGLYDKLGVRKELVSRGRHAAMHSDYVPLGTEERARLQVEASAFYADFVAKVAAARSLGAAEAGAAAEGRVWTGRQAWGHGLVDELGGFEEALGAAKAELGIDAAAPVWLERFPKRRFAVPPFLLRHLLPQTRLGARVSDVLTPDLRFLLQDRLWAILPFHIRIR